MKQARLSTIFNSSKKRDDNLLPFSQKKTLGKIQGVNMHDTSFIKDVMNKGYETMQMKLKTPTKKSTRKSKHSPHNDLSAGSSNEAFSHAKEVCQIQIHEPAAISNKISHLKSVKVQDSNSHKLISRRTNLKRVKGDIDQDESGERIVDLRQSEISFGAKHNYAADQKESLKNITDKSENELVDKQVTFASETSIISSSKRRSLKRVTKSDVERSINGLSYSTLNIVKQLREAKASSKENLNSNEHNQKCFNDLSQETEESKIVKETQPVTNQDSLKSPLKSTISITDLSKKHLDIIRKARQRKQTRNDQWICEQNKSAAEIKVDKILEAPSISEKYSELIAEGELELVLPSHYKHLITCMRSMDQVVYFYKNRSKICKFDELAASVEINMKKRFNMTNFCQILSAVPDLYTYEWTKVTGSQSFSLIVNFPDSEWKQSDY
jgi:hypothetical protein